MQDFSMWEHCRVTFDTCRCESVLMALCKERFGFISVGEMLQVVGFCVGFVVVVFASLFLWLLECRSAHRAESSVSPV